MNAGSSQGVLHDVGRVKSVGSLPSGTLEMSRVFDIAKRVAVSY